MLGLRQVDAFDELHQDEAVRGIQRTDFKPVYVGRRDAQGPQQIKLVNLAFIVTIDPVRRNLEYAAIFPSWSVRQSVVLIIPPSSGFTSASSADVPDQSCTIRRSTCHEISDSWKDIAPVVIVPD